MSALPRARTITDWQKTSALKACLGLSRGSSSGLDSGKWQPDVELYDCVLVTLGL